MLRSSNRDVFARASMGVWWNGSGLECLRCMHDMVNGRLGWRKIQHYGFSHSQERLEISE